jgi:hypothetical protein
MARRKRGRALRRRYGHFGLDDVNSGALKIRQLAGNNPEITAAAIGGASAALAAGMTPGTAAMLGAVAGVAVQQATKK